VFSVRSAPDSLKITTPHPLPSPLPTAHISYSPPVRLCFRCHLITHTKTPSIGISNKQGRYTSFTPELKSKHRVNWNVTHRNVLSAKKVLCSATLATRYEFESRLGHVVNPLVFSAVLWTCDCTHDMKDSGVCNNIYQKYEVFMKVNTNIVVSTRPVLFITRTVLRCVHPVPPFLIPSSTLLRNFRF